MNFQVESALDRGDWDRFVSAQPAGNIMQSYAWGEFQAHRGWEPRYGLLRENGKIRAAVMMLVRRVPGLRAKVFYAPRGPVVDFNDRSAIEALFGEIEAHVNAQNGIFLRCDPYWAENELFNGDSPPVRLKRVPGDVSYWNQPRLVLWLDLEGDQQALLARMAPKCRNGVRRGYKNGVEFSFGGPEDLEDFHRLMTLTAVHKGLPVHGIDYYRRLLETVALSAGIRLFIGRFRGQAVTTGISATYGDTGTLLYAASAPDFHKLNANRAQQWEMIKWSHSEGCRRYDFRGAVTRDPPSEDDPGWGVYQFKKGFGPEFIRLTGYYDVVSRRTLYHSFRFAEEHAIPAAYRLRTWMQR